MVSQILSLSEERAVLKFKGLNIQVHTLQGVIYKTISHYQKNKTKKQLPSSSIFECLRFLSASTADTDWLRGIFDDFEGDTVTWLKRFLLTFVTSVNKKGTTTDHNNFFKAVWPQDSMKIKMG